jgi:hypothetical protein
MKCVYDLETLSGLMSYTGLDVDTEEVYQFVLHKDKFELEELIEHLNETTHQIGYNNLSFDYPIIHFILLSYKDWKWELAGCYITEQDVIDLIYKKAQALIEQQNASVFGSFGIKESEVIIPQMDLFKIWHFNNPARSTGLKALQISMLYHNVLDMSIHHSTKNISIGKIAEILEYNLNDVRATYEFYKLSFDKIQLRKDLQKKYGLKCINFPDSKIGESLILKLYCQKTGLNPWDVKKLRTERSSIALKDCIPDYIRFKTPEFNKLLSTLKSKVITETKGSIKESVIYKGFKYDYGTGGIHGAIKPGVYESTDTHIILDVDVGSMYPTIGVVNKLFPQHLGIEFCEVYNGILEDRMIAKAQKNMSVSDGLKLSLNSVYG